MWRITIAHQCGLFFKKTQLIWTNGLTGSDVRSGTAVLLCVCVCLPTCLRVCIYVNVCPCLHLFIAAPPSPSLTVCVSSFFTLILSLDRGISPQTQSYLSSPLSLSHAKNTPQKSVKAAPTNTQVRVDAEGVLITVGFCGCSLNSTDLRCEIGWHTSGLGYCAIELQRLCIIHLHLHTTTLETTLWC